MRRRGCANSENRSPSAFDGYSSQLVRLGRRGAVREDDRNTGGASCVVGADKTRGDFRSSGHGCFVVYPLRLKSCRASCIEKGRPGAVRQTPIVRSGRAEIGACQACGRLWRLSF